jgi:diguanylate cyclase (GGDEF)-like protein
LRLRRSYALVLLPLLIWFTLAPIALGAPAAFGPGHLLVAGALGAAGVAHLALLRQTRLVGAAVVGIAFVISAASHIWLVLGASTVAAKGAVNRSTFLTLALDLVTALGMQLMTFEDMTYELRVANRRLEAAQDELRQMVTTDPLTGCRNRRYFDEVIGREIQRHSRYQIPLSMLFIDIDRFKAINDTLGHEAGDRVLQRVAAFLIRNVREADYVFRWGGDEFLILISCTESEASRKGAELKLAFAASSDAAALPRGVSVSVGAAEVVPEANDVMAVVKLADERMYADKKRR